MLFGIAQPLALLLSAAAADMMVMTPNVMMMTAALCVSERASEWASEGMSGWAIESASQRMSE